nr:HEPN family nuclease [Gluconobacter kondonii]
MRRSLINQKFIEKHYKKNNLYEVTQLINTFLGALIHPFEASRGGIIFEKTLKEKCSPNFVDTDLYPECKNYYQFIRLLRNGMCHGNIKYNEGKIKNIESIDVWNKRGEEVTFLCNLTVDNMKEILFEFSSNLEYISSYHQNLGGGFEKPSGFEGAFVIPFPPS